MFMFSTNKAYILHFTVPHIFHVHFPLHLHMHQSLALKMCMGVPLCDLKNFTLSWPYTQSQVGAPQNDVFEPHTLELHPVLLTAGESPYSTFHVNLHVMLLGERHFSPLDKQDKLGHHPPLDRGAGVFSACNWCGGTPQRLHSSGVDIQVWPAVQCNRMYVFGNYSTDHCRSVTDNKL